MLEHLKELCALPGISGREQGVRSYILDHLPQECETHCDALGNLLVHKKGRCRPAHRLLLCAHMDEVGLIVNHISSEGLLGFTCVGGIDVRVLIARQVFVGAERLPGVIGLKPVHLTKQEERKKISENGLTERHARALLRVDDVELRGKVLDAILAQHLNVQQQEYFHHVIMKVLNMVFL